MSIRSDAGETCRCSSDGRGNRDGTGALAVKHLMESKTQRYKRRADDLRAIADQLTDKQARATLLEVADDYDRMARAAEKPSPARRDGLEKRR
jgi:hypothetical protein